MRRQRSGRKTQEQRASPKHIVRPQAADWAPEEVEEPIKPLQNGQNPVTLPMVRWLERPMLPEPVLQGRPTQGHLRRTREAGR